MCFVEWCLLLFCIVQVQSARILGIFNIPSISHQVVFQPIWRELSLRGHEVTILSPNPLNDPSLTNLTEIDLGFLYGDLGEINRKIARGMNHWEWIVNFEEFARMNTQTLFAHDKVQALIEDNSRQFDVVLVESIYPTPAVFAVKYNCPLIGIASLDVPSPVHELIGTPGHPLLYPDQSASFRGDVSFFEKVDAVLFSWYRRYLYFYYTLPILDETLKEYFGDNTPKLEDIIRNNMSMTFLNTNPILHKPRPYGPNVIEMGSMMHLKPAKPLPLELQQYLDNATEGVIYFSLGSNVKSAYLDAKKRKVFIDAFSELPFQILWKFETDHLEDQPKNVKISKWLPQRDLLAHPNIKLFITQAGLQSLTESLMNGVPLLAIPFFADQITNADRIAALGIGLQLDFATLTKESFKSSILEITGNKRYRERAAELGKLLKDESASGLEKAVWWIEYVIRNKGSSHFRNRVVDMSWFEYLLVDVYAFLFVVGAALCYVAYRLVRFVVSLFSRLKTNKLKTL